VSWPNIQDGVDNREDVRTSDDIFDVCLAWRRRCDGEGRLPSMYRARALNGPVRKVQRLPDLAHAESDTCQSSASLKTSTQWCRDVKLTTRRLGTRPQLLNATGTT
jgi:hypothetical protein